MTFMGSGGKSALADALARIKGEAGNKPHWTAVAKEVAKIRASGEWRAKYLSPSEWLEAAADASGHTPNTIRRFLSAWAFLQAPQTKPIVVDLFAGGGSFHMEALKSARRKLDRPTGVRDSDSDSGRLDIGAVELIKRINDLSPDRGADALRRHIADDITYREIKREYDQLLAGRAAPLTPSSIKLKSLEVFSGIDAGKLGLRRTRRNKESLAELLSKEIEDLSGPAAIVFANRYTFEFVAPDAVSIGRDGFAVKFVDGFDLKKLGSHLAPGAMKKIIAEAAFSSTFFRRYWLLIDGTAEGAAKIAQAMEKLQLGAVGVAVLTQRTSKKPLDIIRRPSNKPSPDRHDLSRAAVMDQGVPAT